MFHRNCARQQTGKERGKTKDSHRGKQCESLACEMGEKPMKSIPEYAQKGHETKHGEIFFEQGFSQFFIHRHLLKKEENIAHRRQGKTCAQSHDIGVNTEKLWQEKNTKQHRRSAHEIEKKGLFFMPHSV